MSEINPIKNTNQRKLAVGGTFWVGIAILVILLLLSLVALVWIIASTGTTGNEILLKSNMEEQLDLFSVMYKNKDGDVTVESSDNMKVVAPGTDDFYVVCLRNKDNVPINYTIIVEASLIGQHEIPLKFYLLGPHGEDIAGSGKGSTWVERTGLDGSSHNASLEVEESAEYKLYWEWPFDADDDDYDTFLANIEGEDVGIQISVTVRAQEAEGKGYIFGCDSCRFLPWFIVLPLLLLAIVMLLISLLKSKVAPAVVAPAPVIAPPPPVVVPEPKPVPPPAPKPIPKPKKKEGFVGKMEYINIDTLDKSFKDGDKISLAILKQKGLIDPKTKQMKVLARNGSTLTKKFTVETQGVSAEARALITKAGGTVIITKG